MTLAELREGLDDLIGKAERARALLKRIEWRADGECPECFGQPPQDGTPAFGHMPGCELARLLFEMK